MVAVAERLFGRHGYHDVSMDDIARAAGVTKPMLYAYFGSKQGLFVACAEAAGERLRRHVQAAARPDVAPDQRLWRGLLAVFSFVEEHREMWTVYHAPPREGAGEIIGAGAAQGRERMSALMAELLVETAMGEGVSRDAALETAPLAHALTAATMAMAEWWLRHPEESAELQALRMMNLVWTGFENLLAGEMWLPRG